MASRQDPPKKKKKKRSFLKSLSCTSSTAEDRYDRLDSPPPTDDCDEAHEQPLNMRPANGRAVVEKEKRGTTWGNKRDLHKQPAKGKPEAKQTVGTNLASKKSAKDTVDAKPTSGARPVIKQPPSGNPDNKPTASDRSVSKQQPDSKQVIPDNAQATSAKVDFKHRAIEISKNGQSVTDMPESREEVIKNTSKPNFEGEDKQIFVSVSQCNNEQNITPCAPTDYQSVPKVSEKIDSFVNIREQASSVYQRQETSVSPRNVTKGKDNIRTMETSTASLKGGAERTPSKDKKASYSNAAKSLNSNLLFYQGKLRSRPDNVLIDEIHRDWYGKMELLERRHGYIQWLFPIGESQGMNSQAQALQPHEAAALRQDAQAIKRFLTSYKMMLNFYGMKLADIDTGRVERAYNWRERFQNLNNSSHNHLRVTRILKCLGELGLERYKYPLLEFLVHEAVGTGELSKAASSCEEYWIETEEDPTLRQMLLQSFHSLKQGVDQSTKAERESRINTVDSKVKPTSNPNNSTRSELQKECSEENQKVKKLPSRDPQPAMESQHITVCLPDSHQKEASYGVRLVAGNATTRADDRSITSERDRDKTSAATLLKTSEPTTLTTKAAADSEPSGAVTTRGRQDYATRNSGRVEADVTAERVQSPTNPLRSAEKRTAPQPAQGGPRAPDEFYDFQRNTGNHHQDQLNAQVRPVPPATRQDVQSGIQARGAYYAPDAYTRGEPTLVVYVDEYGRGRAAVHSRRVQGHEVRGVAYEPVWTQVISRAAHTLPAAHTTQRYVRPASASTMPRQARTRTRPSAPKGKSKPAWRR